MGEYKDDKWNKDGKGVVIKETQTYKIIQTGLDKFTKVSKCKNGKKTRLFNNRRKRHK